MRWTLATPFFTGNDRTHITTKVITFRKRDHYCLILVFQPAHFIIRLADVRVSARVKGSGLKFTRVIYDEHMLIMSQISIL